MILLRKKYSAFIPFLLFLLVGCSGKTETANNTFKDAFQNKFYVGIAMDTAQILGSDTKSLEIIGAQFNAITPENYMKAENIHPEKDRYDFAMADKFVEYGLKHNMKIIGHTLIWHSQLPDWFFLDDEGNQIDKEELIVRMKNHITTIVSRYKGKVDGWDVVNEAIENDGSYRKSKFYEILGEDFIKLAFQFAHEADSDAELYYNDFSMNSKGKREGVVKMIKMLQSEGIGIDGVGMQSHYLLASERPFVNEIEESIEAFAATGLKVMITELDITVLPFPNANMGGANIADKAEYEEWLNPYTDGLPDSIQSQYNQRYIDLFRLFVKHADVIDRITFWGVTDNQTWKNDWPVPGRTDYPLLFDRNYQPKAVVDSILKIP